MQQPEQQMNQIQEIYLKVNKNFKVIMDSDPATSRQDSAKGLLSLVNQIKTILAMINQMSIEDRTKYFNITYNAVVYVSDIVSMVKKSNFCFQAVKDLLQCVLSMEANIILQDVKYLDKRTKIYLDICRIYQENQYLEPAISLLDSAVNKYKQLKAIHEMDPPLPPHVETILTNDIRILRIMWIKYSIQGGTINSSDWRKKVDQQFGDDISLKLLSLVECLRTETRKQSNIFQKNPHSSLPKTFKQNLVQSGFDLIKPFLDIIQKSLGEQKSKIEREVTFKNTQQLTQQLINEEIKKKREIEEKNVKVTQFKKASASFPFQYHAQLIHYAYQVKNTKVIQALLQCALMRIQCRRIEVPYINDVGIIASSTSSPNIPNGYEKIPIDLNEANLKIQLKKLRKKNQGKGIQQQKPVVEQKDAGKDAKKGAKDPKAPVQEQPKKQNKDVPTEWQLQQINHKYVYMIIKRTMSPENAVYDLNIVMGDEQQGPAGYMDTRRIIVPYIQQDMNVMESQVKQYKGIKQSTHMVPYIILKHSKTGLEDEEEKRNILIDVKPLIGKNPMMPASWGYQKIPIDLRQVPEQFLKNSNHDYVYITFKTDTLFHSNQRHVKILNALNELENAQNNTKPQNTQDEKLLELGINFSLQKLNNLFVVLQQCLDGKLGQDYYVLRCDFLTNLAYHLWVKFLRGPLIQFDYVNQMRLNQELVQYDYQFYRDALQKCKPIFLNGFKVLNFIMINNQRSDVLLLSRVNLQLLKLLEEQKQYKQAVENARMCLDRIRLARDQYLSQGLKGNQNKLLPFSITCSNLKIKETMGKMQEKFKQQRKYIRKLNRIKQRKANGQQELNQEQIQEEEDQFVHFQKKDEIDEIIQKVNSSHSELITILSAVELDIYNVYFRVILKHAQFLRIVQRQSSNNVINGIKQSTIQGMASSMKNKLSLMYSKNEQKNQKNLKDLQTTLIQAEKLPPPKPGFHWLQKRTIEEFTKNPYAMVLLMGNFAAINSQSEDKKYFLQQALQSIKKCIEDEKVSCELAINNSIFIYSTLWDDEIRPQVSSSNISPFKQLYNGIWPCSSQVPNQPILISKSSTSISMKMPPFIIATDGKKKKKVQNMSLYGKPSANGVDVSTNCNQLEGTGIKNRVDEIVKVRNLKPNNLYCFAVAATNQESELQPIGKTCSDVKTSNPLPISMLAAYIAKISYQINEYQTAYNAAKIVTDEICEQSFYQTPDQKSNFIYAYKFKQNVLNNMSLLEIRAVVQSLYIMALCERRKLKELKQNNKEIVPILLQQKQQRITNWLLLASLLNPCLSSPIVSIPFLIPQDFIVLKALSLSLIPPKWMNSRLRQLGVKVMEKVLKWGLEKNQISFSRRIVYKWAERKWLMLGKTIQIQQKKQAKKGAKDTKEQEVKMIDKYCRMLVEKSPGQMELFEDSLAVISEEYSDFTNQFIERAKQQITYYSQYVDNTPEQLQLWTNRLNSKIQLAEYLKDPLNSIKKIGQNSPYYFEYNCKILRKALQISGASDSKQLLAKSQQLTIPVSNKQLSLNKQIQGIIFQAISNNIQWIPSAKNDIIRLQQKTGKNLSKQIKLYTDFENKMIELTQKVSKMDSLIDKYIDFDYINIWLSELYFLKATIATINCTKLDVKNPVKGRFDKVRLMNLQDLLKKKKEVQILDKESISYSQDELKNLNEILKLLCDAAYSSFSIQNWTKLQNVFKLIYNLINKFLITPFYHKESITWQFLTFISLLGILMLNKIRKQGYDTFKKRYQLKQSRTQLKLVATKLGSELSPQIMVEIFQPKYFMPELDPSTTKNYWFQKESRIDLEVLGSIIAYTVQTLRIQNKYNLVINLTRDFCNVTQHFHSLEFLPFMIQSQQKLIDEVRQSIDKENAQLSEVVNQFTKKKSSKMKGERQHKLTNQPLPYQIQYEQKRKKLLESMQLLGNHRSYLQAQIEASQTIIDEIKRDTSKTVLKQREQRKFMAQFGDDEQHMFKNYGDDTRLAKNRKNAVKDIIEQYDRLYKELKNNKTSKDPLAQIQNRNEVGNLHFAAGTNQKAEQFWEDALATIFKTVRPVDNYLQILNEKKTFLVSTVGEKQTLLSLNLLYKIAKYGSYKKLYYQYNCAKFASRLATCLFQSQSKHPQSLLGHANYRLTKLSDKDSLQDQATINLSQLINSLQFFSLRMIDMGCSIQALPMLNLYEHIVIDIVKNVQYSVKVKLIKAIALANCGLISESMSYLAKIANQKDLPSMWIQPSDQMKRQKGSNWYFEEAYFDNSKPWNDQTNKEAIQYIKKVAIRNDFVTNYGLTCIPLFNYLKGLILTRIFSQQIYDNYENNELRITNLQEAENVMRDSLKKLGILEQHYSNLQEIEKAKLKLNKNQISDDAEKALETAKSAAIAYLKASSFEQALLPRYQAQKPSAMKKVFRVQFMARIRFSIHQSYTFRRLTSNSFHVLKNGLTNIHRISYGSRKVEVGFDPQIAAPQPQQPAAGKKDDKKGGKKQQQNQEAPKQVISWEKEKEKQIKAEQSASRISVNIFWHIKLCFEVGRLMYQQNRFKTCKQMLEKLIEQGKEYMQHYYSIFARGYILRCQLRLGRFDVTKFLQLLTLAHQKQYERQEFLDLVMDVAQIIKGQRSIQLFEKGRNTASKLWEELGMKSRLIGIDLQNPQRMFTGKEELTPEQEQQIKRKTKKVADKKGGKDDKKAAKKEDPKNKKKQESKAQYKIETISKYEWHNLLDEQKQSYQSYILKPHPNFHPNNIYSPLPLQYIKCYIRHLESLLQVSLIQTTPAEHLSELAYIKKLLKIVQTYPVSGYFYQLHLYYCAAEINRQHFVNKLKQFLTKNKEKGKKIVWPHGDLPLNAQLINLPDYSLFIYNNRHFVQEAEAMFRKVVALFKGSCLLFDCGFKLDQILWKAADNQFCLAQYCGRLKPKFYQLQNSAQAENAMKLQLYNQIGEALSQLDLSIKVVSCINEFYNNYSELGSKPLQATAKLDNDIVQQINEIDKEFKVNYSKLLSDAIKPKQGINALELITYLAKMHRESQFMTFSNSHIQNVLLRCHRMLISGCPPYKDKCVISNVEYTAKKSIDDKIMEPNSLCLKSRLNGNNEQFLYVLGGADKDAKPYYGRVSIQSVGLSNICQRLYQIRTKMAISEKKSEAVKNRDWMLYQKQLKQILIVLGKKFSPGVNEIPQAIKISLTTQNVTILIKMLQSSGINCANKQINTYLRYLHQQKYKLKVSNT